MSNPYREIFSVPGAKGFSAAGFFARLPIAMAPIGIVAMLSQTRGEYWIAGAVSATFALTNALAAPQISRLVDRFGQSAIIVPTTVVSVIAFAFLILSANQDWPEWTLVRLGSFCCRHAQHAGHAAGALDRDLSRPPRTEHRLRL
jgi:MFS family permease